MAMWGIMDSLHVKKFWSVFRTWVFGTVIPGHFVAVLTEEWWEPKDTPPLNDRGVPLTAFLSKSSRLHTNVSLLNTHAADNIYAIITIYKGNWQGKSSSASWDVPHSGRQMRECWVEEMKLKWGLDEVSKSLATIRTVLKSWHLPPNSKLTMT